MSDHIKVNLLNLKFLNKDENIPVYLPGSPIKIRGESVKESDKQETEITTLYTYKINRFLGKIYVSVLKPICFPLIKQIFKKRTNGRYSAVHVDSFYT